MRAVALVLLAATLARQLAHPSGVERWLLSGVIAALALAFDAYLNRKVPQ